MLRTVLAILVGCATAFLVFWTAWCAIAPSRSPWAWDIFILLGVTAVPSTLLAHRVLERLGDIRGLQVLLFLTTGFLSTWFIYKTVGAVAAVIFLLAYMATVGRMARRLFLPEDHDLEDNDSPDDQAE